MLSKHFFDVLTAQILCYKLALGRIEEICGDSVHVEVLCYAPLAVLIDTPNINPTHVVLLDELLPTLLSALVIERYTIDLKTLRSELLVCSNEVRNLATARTAPCSPEVSYVPTV